MKERTSNGHLYQACGSVRLCFLPMLLLQGELDVAQLLQLAITVLVLSTGSACCMPLASWIVCLMHDFNNCTPLHLYKTLGIAIIAFAYYRLPERKHLLSTYVSLSACIHTIIRS